MSPFEEPISLEGVKLVKAFAACLADLAEDRQLPRESFAIWSMPLSETLATEAEMQVVGQWFAQRHKTCPSLPYIIHAVRTLKANGALPPNRLAKEVDRNAMNILKALEGMGISADDCAQSLMLAGTLAHLASYRRQHPYIDRQYLRLEVEGIARMCDYMADEILDEVQSGQGDLRELGICLFHLEPEV